MRTQVRWKLELKNTMQQKKKKNQETYQCFGVHSYCCIKFPWLHSTHRCCKIID